MTTKTETTRKAAGKAQKTRNAAKAAAIALPLAFGGAMVAQADEAMLYAPSEFAESLILAQATSEETAVPSLTLPRTEIEAAAENGTDNASFIMMENNQLQIGNVTFNEPWMLLGFLSFPLLWMLMRATPPTPRREGFPAIRLLFNLKSQDQEPAEMPLWQRLLRLSLAGAVITAMADPQFDQASAFDGQTQILIIVDNGWASAMDWEERRLQLQQLISQAGDDNRAVSIVTAAMPEDGGALLLTPPVAAEDALSRAMTVDAMPWPVDREAVSQILEEMVAGGMIVDASVIWLSNGLSTDHDNALLEDLQNIGPVRVLIPEQASATYMLSQPQFGEELLQVTIERAEALSADEEAQSLSLTAYDDQGRPLAREVVSFEAGDEAVLATFALPLEVRNIVSRISIDDMPHAAATILLDERWRIRPVGVVEVPTGESGAELLRGDNYVTQALQSYTDVTRDEFFDILQSEQSVIIRPDDATLAEDDLRRIEEWVRKGGTYVLFAGPDLAAGLAENDGAISQTDSLLPVPMRPNLRILDENFSGAEPLGLAEFEEGSPFYGLRIDDEVRVNRVVMAEPSATLDDHVWARLEDGSPFITARQVGEGWTVLIHSTANPQWSDLVLSGMFVEMMQAIVSHSNGAENGLSATPQGLPPYRSLNVQGQLVEPFSSALSITQDVVEAGEMSAIYPPGYYGNREFRYAYNVSDATSTFGTLQASAQSDNVTFASYETAFSENNLKGLILSAAFMLAIADMGIMLGQRHALPLQGNRHRRRKTKVKPSLAK